MKRAALTYSLLVLGCLVPNRYSGSLDTDGSSGGDSTTAADELESTGTGESDSGPASESSSASVSTSGSGSTSNAAGESESSETETNGTSTTGDGGACPPDEGDDACEMCSKDLCCDEYVECYDDPDCACLSDCVRTDSLEQCFMTCEIESLPATAVQLQICNGGMCPACDG